MTSKPRFRHAYARHVQRLRMDIQGDKEPVGIFQFADALCHRHRLPAAAVASSNSEAEAYPSPTVGSSVTCWKLSSAFSGAPLRTPRLIRGVGGIPAGFSSMLRRITGGSCTRRARPMPYIGREALCYARRWLLFRQCDIRLPPLANLPAAKAESL